MGFGKLGRLLATTITVITLQPLPVLAQTSLPIELTSPSSPADRPFSYLDPCFKQDSLLAIISTQYADAGWFDQALQLNETIREEKAKGSARVHIADRLAAAGQVDRALQLIETIPPLSLSPITFQLGNLRTLGLQAIAVRVAARNPEQALQIAAQIPDSFDRAVTLFNLATQQAKAGQVAEADRLFAQAFQLVKTNRARPMLAGDIGLQSQLQIITQQLLEANQPDRALQVVQVVFDDFSRDMLLTEIGVKLARTGQIDQALQITPKLQQFGKEAILFEVIEQLLKAKQIDRALQVAQSLPPDSSQGFKLSQIAEKLAQAGQIDRALQVARGIQRDRIGRAVALANIGVAVAESGQLDRALQIAAEVPLDDLKLNVQAEVAAQRIKTGQIDQALKQIRQIQSLASRSHVLSRVAKPLLDAKQPARAESVLAEALKLAQGLKNPQEKAQALRSVAIAQARIGQYRAAGPLAQTISNAGVKRQTFRRLTEIALKEKQFHAVLDLTAFVPDTSLKAEMLLKVVNAFVQAKQYDRALEVLAQIDNRWEIAQTDFNYTEIWSGMAVKAEVMAAITLKLVEAGLPEQAVLVAQQVPADTNKAIVLATLAVRLTQSGQRDRAESLFTQAIKLARTGNLTTGETAQSNRMIQQICRSRTQPIKPIKPTPGSNR